MKEQIYQTTEKRTNALRAFMESKKLDAAFVSSGPGVRYLSGFAGTPGDASLVITPEEAFIITDSRYTIQAGEQCPYYKLLSGSSVDPGKVREILGDRALNIGFENLEISYNQFKKTEAALPQSTFAPLDGAIRDLRNIKDETELDNIHNACRIACVSLAETVPYIVPGAAELDVANELEYRMKKNGASGPSFDTIVASGVRGALPHGLASEKLIKSGEMVTIDFGCLYNGYCSDMTRTFSVGDPDPEMKKIYDIVLYAQMTAIDAYKPGMSGVELDKVARDIIADAGYGKYFGHGLGHGVGLEIHEGVGVSPRGSASLPENTVFSIEPGIYIEGLGGVRIEDLITSTGGVKTVLTSISPKALMIL